MSVKAIGQTVAVRSYFVAATTKCVDPPSNVFSCSTERIKIKQLRSLRRV